MDTDELYLLMMRNALESYAHFVQRAKRREEEAHSIYKEAAATYERMSYKYDRAMEQWLTRTSNAPVSRQPNVAAEMDGLYNVLKSRPWLDT